MSVDHVHAHTFAHAGEDLLAPDRLRRMFLDESGAHLAAVEAALAALAEAEAEPALLAAAEEMLRHLHTLKGAAGTVGLDGIGDAAHRLEELCADVHAGRLAPTLGVLETLDDHLGGLAAMLAGARQGHVTPTLRSPADERELEGTRALPGTAHLEALEEGIGDLVVLRTRVERSLRELEGAARDLGRARQGLGAATAGEPHARKPPRRTPRNHAKADRLAALEAHFQEAGTQLERATRALGHEVEALRRVTARFDDELRRVRKVPLAVVFQRLPPALRELELRTGRRASLAFAGGDVEVDQSLAGELGEALLHLLRNAVAHGLELPAERLAVGKATEGRIEVSAHSDGETVEITFADDGRGLDRAEIHRALVRHGRIAADAPLPEAMLVDAIFEAGFSSRAVADQLAGRGLGLNIVKRAALRAGGDVRVFDRAGHGTRFVLSAPQHGAITLAVLFKVGGQVYGIPAAHVERAVTTAPEIAARGPALSLHALFGAEAGPRPGHTGLELRAGGRRFVITCDKIVGPRTVVVRPLGPLFASLPLYAGVVVSGSGKAQLVLDVAELAELAAHPPARSASPPPRTTPRVLVVDDSRLAREATARALHASGMSAVTAEDGLAAWELLGERGFDAVITDLEMPRLDGFDLIARIRAEPAFRRLPVVVVSARAARAPRARALGAGADALLPKSPHRRQLLDTLTTLLSRKL